MHKNKSSISSTSNIAENNKKKDKKMILTQSFVVVHRSFQFDSSLLFDQIRSASRSSTRRSPSLLVEASGTSNRIWNYACLVVSNGNHPTNHDAILHCQSIRIRSRSIYPVESNDSYAHSSGLYNLHPPGPLDASLPYVLWAAML